MDDEAMFLSEADTALVLLFAGALSGAMVGLGVGFLLGRLR